MSSGSDEFAIDPLLARLESVVHLDGEDLQRFIDTTLDAATERRYREHLARCRTCRERVEDLRGALEAPEAEEDAAGQAQPLGPSLRVGGRTYALDPDARDPRHWVVRGISILTLLTAREAEPDAELVIHAPGGDETVGLAQFEVATGGESRVLPLAAHDPVRAAAGPARAGLELVLRHRGRRVAEVYSDPATGQLHLLLGEGGGEG